MKLDDSQANAVNINMDERQVVIAGPGAGKTFTSIQLIRRISESATEPELSQVVYISFSNSAIRAMLEGHEEELDALLLKVNVGTLDSFAYSITSEAGFNDSDIPNMFVHRLQNATKVLGSGGTDFFEDSLHVIFDEAQDIYGDRKDFANAIIAAIPTSAGVTILGDPLQSIYSYLNTSTAPNNGLSLLDDAIQNPMFVKKELSGRYRARTPKAKQIQNSIGHLKSDSSQERRVSTLRQAICRATPVSKTNVKQWARQWDNHSALLTRTNAEMLQLHQDLFALDVETQLVFPPDQRLHFPKWIFLFSKEIGSSKFSFSELGDFLAKYNERAYKQCEESGIDLSEPWKDKQIRDLWRVFSFRPGYASSLVQHSKPIVTTIHQSKGLEFSDVIMINPLSLLENDHFGSEPELAYVGLSRTVNRLFSIDWDFAYSKNSNRTNGRPRVMEIRRNRIGPFTSSIEIKPNDVARDDLYSDEGANNILLNASSSTPLSFSLLNERTSFPTYRLFIDNIKVGVTNRDFGESIKKALKLENGPWPELGPVFTDECETTFGHSATTENTCWLTPRPFGLAKVIYKNRK